MSKSESNYRRASCVLFALILFVSIATLNNGCKKIAHPISEAESIPIARLPGWENNFIGSVLPEVTNSFGQVITGLYPFAGSVNISLEKLDDTMLEDQQDFWKPGDITKGRTTTIGHWVLKSLSPYFIEVCNPSVDFIDSWGKPIGTNYFDHFVMKPYESVEVLSVIYNMPREKLYTWRIHTNLGHYVWRDVVEVQLVEGSNSPAEVNINPIY